MKREDPNEAAFRVIREATERKANPRPISSFGPVRTPMSAHGRLRDPPGP